MKLNIRNISIGILALFIIANLLVIFKIQYFYIETIFLFIFLTTIPGLLIMLMFKIRKIGFWEYLVYAIGLSIAFLIFGGLAVNGILPWLHITDKPLSLIPLLISFDIFLSLFGLIAYKRNKDISLKIRLPKPNWLSRIFFIIPMIFLLLSILGAITLNNGGPNYLTIIMLGGIVLYILGVVLFRKILDQNIYPWAIFMISLSLLLMYSLRSWHIIGWDIKLEYKIFRLTESNYLWSFTNLYNDYNTCLSITILPTVLHNFLNINSEYIFKLLYQLLFAEVPLIIYLLSKRYTTNIIAFLASFFFIIQPTFYGTMPALARQEVAFIYFSLILFTLFDNNIHFGTKNILVFIFGASMIVSHYSTSYIALTLIIFTYIVRKISNINPNLNKRKIIQNKPNHKLRLNVILMLIIFTFIWNTQLTNSFNSLIGTAHSTLINMKKTFTEEMKSASLQSLFVYSGSSYTDDQLNLFIKNYIPGYLEANKIKPILDNEKYTLTIIPGTSFYTRNIFATQFVKYIYLFVKFTTMLSLLIGFIYLVYIYKKDKTKTDIEYIYLSIIGAFLILLILVLPYLSIAYNFERLLQQNLIFLSLIIVFGIQLLFKYLKNIKYIFISIIFIIYFIYLSGVLAPILGGSNSLFLLNHGRQYDSYYTHSIEIQAINWLDKYSDSKNDLYADSFAQLKIDAYSKKNYRIVPYIIPDVINRSGYIYASYTNIMEEIASIDERQYFMKGVAFTNYPFDFINNNKSLIYNNGGSKIFR
jgi:uncharacterized membrane protein